MGPSGARADIHERRDDRNTGLGRCEVEEREATAEQGERKDTTAGVIMQVGLREEANRRVRECAFMVGFNALIHGARGKAEHRRWQVDQEALPSGQKRLRHR